MLNDDVLIKFSRIRGHRYTWPEQVWRMKERLEHVKSGFPGIRNNHLDLIEFRYIKEGDIFIHDRYLEGGSGDEAPIMYRITEPWTAEIEGIGIGQDSRRDPDRTKIRVWDTVGLGEILNPGDLVLRVNVRPTENGGPGYYYFFKSYRDFRP